MLSFVAFALIASIRSEDSVDAFLAFQDTVFAVRRKGSWMPPGPGDRLPSGKIEVSCLGLSSVKDRVEATVGGWESDGNFWFLACEDFDRVLLWKGEPHYPRRSRSFHGDVKPFREQALLLLRGHGAPQGTFKRIQIMRVALDRSGDSQCLCSYEYTAAHRHFNGVFLAPESNKRAPRSELAFSTTGWPRVLAVADLNNDKRMEVVVGGITETGMSIAVWTYDFGLLKPLAAYSRS